MCLLHGWRHLPVCMKASQMDLQNRWLQPLQLEEYPSSLDSCRSLQFFWCCREVLFGFMHKPTVLLVLQGRCHCSPAGMVRHVKIVEDLQHQFPLTPPHHNTIGFHLLSHSFSAEELQLWAVGESADPGSCTIYWNRLRVLKQPPTQSIVYWWKAISKTFG